MSTYVSKAGVQVIAFRATACDYLPSGKFDGSPWLGDPKNSRIILEAMATGRLKAVRNGGTDYACWELQMKDHEVVTLEPGDYIVLVEGQLVPMYAPTFDLLFTWVEEGQYVEEWKKKEEGK